MKKPTDTAIIESLLRVYEKSDDESLLIPRPALFNELGVFSQPLMPYFQFTLATSSAAEQLRPPFPSDPLTGMSIVTDSG